MTRQIAQFLWIGPKLSAMEQMCLQSFLAVGYEAHLYAYDRIEGVPDGVCVLDASEILPADQIFRLGPGFAEGSYTGFSNLFRLHLLFSKGGWWFDLDFAALQLKPEPADLLFASEWEGAEYPTNCAIWCRPRDPRIGWLKDRCEELIRTQQHLEFGRTGWRLVRDAVAHLSLKKNVAPWWEFCPYPSIFADRMAYRGRGAWLRDQLRLGKHLCLEIYKPEFRAGRITRNTRAIHWFNQVWADYGMDKDAIYHARSPYGRTQRRFILKAP